MNRSYGWQIWRLAPVLAMAVIMAGCATDITTKKDPFFEKWETMGKTSLGHSPAPRENVMGLKGETPKAVPSALAAERGLVQAKQLPKRKISLKMRQADVKAVLRSLARIEGQNILIKNDIKGDITIDFKGVPWDQAFRTILNNQGLEYEWEGEIIRVMTLEDVERDLKRKTQEYGVRQVTPLQTKVISINYADAKGLKDNIQEFLTKDKDGKPRGSVRVDDHSNSLIIQAIQDDLIRMAPIIEQIDKPTPQVLIKANIVEATKSTARELGVRWGGMARTGVDNSNLWITPGGITTTGSVPIDPIGGKYTPSYASPGLSGQGVAFGAPSQVSNLTGAGALGLMFGTIGGNILEMQLNALQTEGKLNILSSPSITTLDNQTAYTENGDRVPYVTEETSSTGAITKSVKFEDVVLRLEITPHVIDGKNLKMKVEVKKDEVDSARNVQGNPYIIKKKTSTNLIVKDGETIVISGLSKQKRQDAETGLPWLKDIPGLGWLFKSVGKSENMEEVLIFITPNILPVQTVAAVPAVPEKQAENKPVPETKKNVK
ncbi:MAG: type IV pilus secretin PilQ [Deltaproteobacteria bacterium]|nr:type IV pilus secretin PilQ [Deltaproteobacteria bacterium]